MKQSTKQKIQDGLDKSIDVLNRVADKVTANEDLVRRTILVIGVGLIVYKTTKRYTPQNIVNVKVTNDVIESAKVGLEIETIRTIFPDPYPKSEINKLYKLEISDKDVRDMTDSKIGVVFDIEDKNFLLIEYPNAIRHVVDLIKENTSID